VAAAAAAAVNIATHPSFQRRVSVKSAPLSGTTQAVSLLSDTN